MPRKVAVFLPNFGHGGTEGVALKVLQHLDRNAFSPLLILQRNRGEFLKKLPKDVPVLGLSRPRPPGCIRELASVLSREQVSLVVTMNNATNLYAIAAARLSTSNTATLISDHTPLSAFLSEAKFPTLRRMAIKRLYPRADLAAGPLDKIGEDIQQILGPKAPPFTALTNPVVDQIKRLRPLAKQARHIVSVGRLSSEKRFDLLLDSFALLRKTLPDAKLTIYGEGTARDALESQITRLDLSGHARLAGYTSDLDAVHGAADLFVCTSRREGLGNAIIEAMARGVPVVSVDCPFGPKHLLKNNLAGRLVTSHDAQNLSAAISDVLMDLEERQRITQAGLEVAQTYTVNAAVKGYEAAFRRAMDLRGI